MTVTLNETGYRHARQLVADGRYVLDDRDRWSDDQPSTSQENDFIEANGIDEFGKWFLGVDDDLPPDRKGHYKFPYGDFEQVHRCGVISAESRAGQYDHGEIEQAAAHLHGMLDSPK